MARIEPIRLRSPLTLLAILAAGACESGSTLSLQPRVDDIGSPTVTSTEPSVGEQGEHLRVRIFGSGFNSTSASFWERNGATDPKVTVHSTSYVSPTELDADISIAPDATVTLYDVAVTIVVPRKKGVGIERGVGREVFHVTTPMANFSGAITSVGFQTVQLRRSRYSDWRWLSAGTLTSTVDFSATIAAGTASCWTSPADVSEKQKTALFRRLSDIRRDREHLIAWVGDQATFGHSESGISIQWQETNDSIFRAGMGLSDLGEHLDAARLARPPAAPTVNVLSPLVYQYFGGALVIETGRTITQWGDLWSDVLMACPNRDTITVTLSHPW